MTDLVPSRLKFAQSLVPTVQTVQIQREWTDVETAAAITKAAGGPLRVALECTGFEGSIRAAIFVSAGRASLGPHHQSRTVGSLG